MWQVLPWERLALSLLLVAVAALLALPLRRLTRCSIASALAVIWLGALGFFVGVMPIFAAALIGAAALAIGLQLIGARTADSPFPVIEPAQLPLAMTLGLVLVGGSSGWLLSLPIHYRPVWLLILALPIAVLWRSLIPALDDARRHWSRATEAAPRTAALTISLLGLASTGLWFPTLQADDVAYHLGLPSQLLAHAFYAPLPQFQMWSYAPWLGDTLHGIASVLARRDARGGVNLLWLVSSVGALSAIAWRLRPDATFGWSTLAVFASFPPLVWLGAGMQTELSAIAVMLALLHALLAPSLRGRGWIAVTLFAGLIALKPIHAVSAMPLLLWGGWHHRAEINRRLLLGAPLLTVLIAGSSYLQAWWATGNPVLPLINSVFESPFIPLGDIADPRWHAGYGITLPWRLVFDSTRYFEGWNGGLGFSLIALAGGSLLALGDRALRGPTLAVTLGLALTLVPMQYARYAFPAMLLLGALSLPALHRALGRRSYAAAIVGLCVVNLAFQANASWLHHSAALKRLIRSAGDATELYVHYLPERELIRRHDDGQALWLATDPARHGIAELGARARSLSTHAPLLLARREKAEQDPSGERWVSLIVQLQPDWLLVSSATASPALRSALDRLDCEQVDRLGDLELLRIPSGDQ